MRLSRKQKRAIRLAVENSGSVSTFQIAGTTGGSLHKRGLVYRHFIDKDYGSTITYELSAAGWRMAQELGYAARPTEAEEE